jgi:hypothetical protein
MIKSIVFAIIGLVLAIVLLVVALLAFSLVVMVVGAILNLFSPSRSARAEPGAAAS